MITNSGPALKKLTYTTNAIEHLNREIRRETKGDWPSDKALLIQSHHTKTSVVG